MSINNFFTNLGSDNPNIQNNQGTNNKTNNGTNSGESELVFVTVIVAVLIAWILVALWTRVIENFTFGTLGLDGNSAWHAFIVAASVTVIFIVGVWVVDQYELIPGGLETIIEGNEETSFETEIPGTNIGGSGSNTLSNSSLNQNGVFIPKSMVNGNQG